MVNYPRNWVKFVDMTYFGAFLHFASKQKKKNYYIIFIMLSLGYARFSKGGALQEKYPIEINPYSARKKVL